MQCFEQENDAVHESRASVWLKNGKLSGRLEYGEEGGQGMCRNAGKKVVATRGIRGKETCSSEPRRWNWQALALDWTRRGKGMKRVVVRVLRLQP